MPCPPNPTLPCHARAHGLIRLLPLALLLLFTAQAVSAPQAAFVLDIRTGAIYRAENADARLHPASLTKMMTLYLAFEAVEAGEIDLDATTIVSPRAASAPGSRLGLVAGQGITLRHLVRATALRSGNDAAIALAEAIAGSEPAFVERMNDRARAMGLTGTSFRNAHGLTAEGHLSTARDMSDLGRRLWWDYPGYWALFSQRSADAGVAQVAHTNRRFLGGYSGADGIKTGYTRAAGYNLTGSARRGEVHLIATVFGATSSAERAARVSALLDDAFRVAPQQAAPIPPRPLPGAPQHGPGAGSAGGAALLAMGAWSSERPEGRAGFSAARPLAGGTGRPLALGGHAHPLTASRRALAVSHADPVGVGVQQTGSASALGSVGLSAFSPVPPPPGASP